MLAQVVAWLFGFVVGVASAAGVFFVLAKLWPSLLKSLRPRTDAVPVYDPDPLGVNPADPNLPDAVDPTEEAKIARIPHAELRTLVRALSTWKPKRHQHEGPFQQSFQRHLRKLGYGDDSVKRHPRVPWTADDRDPNSDDSRAEPDFSVESVLVEIKRNINASSESDRALGQMARYCIAWRKRGPALLIVCNEFNANLRTFVERTVRGWKAQGVPVMAYFARHPSVASGDDEFLAGTFEAEA